MGRLRFLLITALEDLAPTGLKKAADPTPPIYNLWDYNQTEAFGIATALSGNLGKSNTPVISTDSGVTWAGTGSMIAGPDVYYTTITTGSSLSVGDVVGYEIAYTNTSGGALTNVALTDAPVDPTLLQLVVDPTDGSDPATAFCPYTSYDGTPSGPTYDLASSTTSTAVWQTVASLAAGASFTVGLCAEVIAGVKGDRIENTASVTYTLPDTSTETLT